MAGCKNIPHTLNWFLVVTPKPQLMNVSQKDGHKFEEKGFLPSDCQDSLGQVGGEESEV